MALSTCKECGGKVSTLAKTCPHCGVPNPAIKKKTSKKDKDSRIWAHCSNKRCEDYTQMYRLYSSKLKSDTCIICNSLFKQATMENGRPVMPSKIDFNNVPAKKNIKPWGSEPPKETASSSSSISTTSSSNTSSANNGAWDKFLDGKLDLAAAFWGFGVFGSVIVGLICGFLAEAVGSFFIFVYIVATIAIISGLWQCADTHKKNMTIQKQSTVWGILTQAYCVLGGLGLINFIIEYMK